MSTYVGYITLQEPTMEDLQKISFYTPGPAVEDVLCDTQFFYGQTHDLYYALYQIRLHENSDTHDHMYFVCEENVYTSGDPKFRDLNVRAILSDFYANFGTGCYAAEIPHEPRRIFVVEGINNKALSNLMAKMARGRIGIVGRK